MASNVIKQFQTRFSADGADVFAKLSAAEFMEVWNHFDQDGNGYIEDQELDAFIENLISNMKKGPAKKLSAAELSSMKKVFLTSFDDNHDNRIDIHEMVQILPTEENFLALFQINHPLESSMDFMRIWKKYDEDCSGFIEADELKAFVREMLIRATKNNQVSDEEVTSYADTILNLFDKNGDGKLQLSELARLLPVKENFLLRPPFKKGIKITEEDLNRVFDLYDRDGNGTIENEELHGFVKDLLELAYEDYTAADLESVKDSLMKILDVDGDGKINKKEMLLIVKQMESPADD